MRFIPDWLKEFKPTYSGLTHALPENVHLLTFESLNRNQIILRLEHIYEKGEDPKLSQTLVVVLTGLFTDFQVAGITELNLSANQYMSDKKMLNWHTTMDDSYMKQSSSVFKVGSSWQVMLKPMEIRTYLMDIYRK